MASLILGLAHPRHSNCTARAAALVVPRSFGFNASQVQAALRISSCPLAAAWTRSAWRPNDGLPRTIRVAPTRPRVRVCYCCSAAAILTRVRTHENRPPWRKRGSCPPEPRRASSKWPRSEISRPASVPRRQQPPSLSSRLVRRRLHRCQSRSRLASLCLRSRMRSQMTCPPKNTSPCQRGRVTHGRAACYADT